MLTLATASLLAQGTTYEVNFASIAFVNLDLNEACSREIIYRNLLSGNADVDGDGLEPPEGAFIIEIADTDPGNNGILDGCGTFQYTVRPNPDSMVIGFTFGQGMITGRDVTPPVQFLSAAADPGPFFSTQLQELTINTLSSAVSRQFVVDGETTFPQMGTLDGQLMARLVAGGTIPRFTDACSDIAVTVEDAINVTGECSDIIITRTFTATDASTQCTDGGFSSGEVVVSYDIVLQRPTVDSIMAPDDLVTYECNDRALNGGNFPDPSADEYPFINTPGGRVFLNSVFGNIGASFTNSGAVTTCNNTIKYVRTYTVIDWCDTDNVRTFTQLVKVGDTGAPTIIAPTQDLDFDGVADDGPLVFSTNAPGCGAFINTRATGLATTDGCSAVTTLEAIVLISGDANNTTDLINVNAPNATNRLTPFLPVGTHVLRYVATDECGNVASTDLDIVIIDRSGPVVIAEDQLNVSLSNAGFATVGAVDIDNGSYDDCSDVILEIAFANPVTMGPIGAFGPTLTLTCIDVGSIPVVLRVTDSDGNSNSRVSIINVIDNSAPVCIAPGNLTITCDQADDLLPEDLNTFFLSDPDGTSVMLDDLFGQPASLDNCGNELVTQQVLANINDCGTGTVTRTFIVADSRGFTSAPGCEQVVSVRGVRNYTLEFPGDAAATCGNTPDFDDVAYTPIGCDMVVSNIDVDTFFASSDACFKVRRTIEIINWCEYDGNGEFYTVRRDADNDGNLEESTFLHVIPNGNINAGDDVALLDQDANRANNNNIGFLDADDQTATSGDDDNDGDMGYADSRSRGAFRYVQFIKVSDNTAPSITNIFTDPFSSVGCENGGVQIDYTLTDDCRDANLTARVELDLNYFPSGGFNATRVLTEAEILNDGDGRFNVLIDDLPQGEHAVRVRASDGCGNVNGSVIRFEIQDNSVITPICPQRLTFTLANDGVGGGFTQVAAEDYIISLSNNCNNLPVTYSIYRENGEADAPGFNPTTGQATFPVSCADVGEIPVRIYTFTPSGRGEFCSALAIVEAAETVSCNTADLASIAGFVTTPQNELLEDIPVHITDMASMDGMMMTDANGSFLFTSLSAGGQYMVRPEMSDEVNTRRVKTSDIAVITAHALGTMEINDPYRMIAADVTADGYIDVSDVINIRRVLLGLDLTYRNGPTWRFIRRDFDLDGLTEGWDPALFPTEFVINSLEGHNREADFVAVEIGDVYVQPGTPRASSSLAAIDAALTAGETHDLTLTATDLIAFQGTLNAAEGLSIEHWSSSRLGAGNVNDEYLYLGLLAMSYNADDEMRGDEVLTLHLRADQDLRISDYLSVTDRITAPEGVTPAGNSQGLYLDFSEAPASDDFILHQNYPNPVDGRTNIVFELPTAASAMLEIHDLRGRLVATRTVAAFAGRNTIALSSDDDLNGAIGILSYTITVGRERLTKRMTVVATR